MRVGVPGTGSGESETPTHSPPITGLAILQTQKNRFYGGRVRLYIPRRQSQATDFAVAVLVCRKLSSMSIIFFYFFIKNQFKQVFFHSLHHAFYLWVLVVFKFFKQIFKYKNSFLNITI